MFDHFVGLERKGLIDVESSVLFLYLMKISEKLCFPEVFKGYRNGTLSQNGSNKVIYNLKSQ